MSTRMRRVVAKSLELGLLAALSLAISITSFAQSDNTQISGFVKDQAGGVISGAKVTVKSDTRAFERSATTNAEGYFVITQLPPGLYTVKVEASGFKQYQENSRKLDPNLPASIDVSLQPGQLTETVTVTASVAQVQSRSRRLLGAWSKPNRSNTSSSTDAIRSSWRNQTRRAGRRARRQQFRSDPGGSTSTAVAPRIFCSP